VPPPPFVLFRPCAEGSCSKAVLGLTSMPVWVRNAGMTECSSQALASVSLDLDLSVADGCLLDADHVIGNELCVFV
jgi:hypothetical protein